MRDAVKRGCLLVTGSSGFIGHHLCCRLAQIGPDRPRLIGLDRVPAPQPRGYDEIVADIRDQPRLHAQLAGVKLDVAIHLAAVAEAIVPFDKLPELFSTNLNGTLNVLEAAAPSRIIFASSASVYGNTSSHGDTSLWENVNPLGCYAATKAIGELACGSWARTNGAAAVCLRLGNVVGPGCHGLVEYLVSHALVHPDSATPAQMRGEGHIVRDYVTVDYVAAALSAACQVAVPDGTSVAYNVSSGVTMTNAAVASIVTAALARHGYRLTTDLHSPVAPEEPRRTALEVREAAAILGLRLPDRDELIAAIEAAVLHRLQSRSAG